MHSNLELSSLILKASPINPRSVGEAVGNNRLKTFTSIVPSLKSIFFTRTYVGSSTSFNVESLITLTTVSYTHLDVFCS